MSQPGIYDYMWWVKVDVPGHFLAGVANSPEFSAAMYLIEAGSPACCFSSREGWAHSVGSPTC